MAQGQFVQLVVLKAASNKNCSGTSQQETQAGKAHIGAAKHVGHGEIILVQDLGHHHAVEIGFVGPQ